MTRRYILLGPVLAAFFVSAPLQAQVQPDNLTAMELQEARQGLEVAWSEMEALQAEAGKKNALINRLRDAAIKLRANNEEWQETSKDQQRRIEELEKDLSKGRDVRKKGPTRAEEKKIGSLRRQVEDLTDKVRAQESEVRKLKSAKSSESAKAGDADRDLRRAEKKISSLEKQLGKLHRSLEDQEAMVAEKRKEIRDLREALAARDAVRSTPVADIPLPDDDAEAEMVMTREKPMPPREATTPRPKPTPQSKPEPEVVDNSDNLLKLIVEGNRALKTGDIANAEELFNKALAEDQDLVGARMGLAACYYSRSNFKEAKFILEKLLSEDRNDAQALGLRGIIAWQEGDNRKAAKELERAVRLDPQDAQLQSFLGVIEHTRGRSGRAIDALRRAIELDPQHTEAIFNLSVLLAQAKPPQLDEARGYYERAISLGSERDDQLEKLLNP